MRVIIVTNNLGGGGAERQALLLGRHLVQHAEVQIWGLEGSGPLASRCEQYGIAWRDVQFPWPANTRQLLRGLPRYAWALRRAKPDVLLPYTIFPNVVCSLVWRWVGARACIWYQLDEGVTRLGPGAERLAARHVRWFIGQSDNCARFLTDALKVNRDRIRVIRTGVEQPSLRPDRVSARRQLALSDDCFVACMIANLTRFKDHPQLLRAWRVVVERLGLTGKPPVLLLAGRLDSSYESLKAQTEGLHLGHAVRFLGYVPEIWSVLSAADLGVFSSRSEGCPNGVVECMAAGLPVVGSDIAGVREAVGPMGYRFLSPPDDPNAMAEQILEFATNPQLRMQIGASNQERARKEFGVTRMCEEIAGVITEALK